MEKNSEINPIENEEETNNLPNLKKLRKQRK